MEYFVERKLDITYTREQESDRISKLEQKITDGKGERGGLRYFAGMPTVDPSDEDYLKSLKERLNDNSRWVLLPEHLVMKP
jgi:hypothetical protein